MILIDRSIVPVGVFSGCLPLWKAGDFKAGVCAVALNSNIDAVFAAGNDGTLRRFAISNGVEVAARSISTFPQRVLRFSENKNHLLVAGEEPEVRLLDATTFDVVVSVRLAEEFINGGAWHPNGDLIAIGGSRGVVSIIETSSGKTLERLSLAKPVMSLDWSADGHWLGGSAYDGSVAIWRTQDWVKHLYQSSEQPIWGAKFTSIGDLLMGREDGLIQDTVGRVRWAGHHGPVSGIAPLAHGFFASLSHDESIRIWTPDGAKAIEELQPAYPGWTACIASDTDGRKLLTTDSRGQSLCLYAVDNLIERTRKSMRSITRVDGFVHERVKKTSAMGRRGRIRRLHESRAIVAAADYRSFYTPIAKLASKLNNWRLQQRWLSPLDSLASDDSWAVLHAINDGVGCICFADNIRHFILIPHINNSSRDCSRSVIVTAETACSFAQILCTIAFGSTMFSTLEIFDYFYCLSDPQIPSLRIGWDEEKTWVAWEEHMPSDIQSEILDTFVDLARTKLNIISKRSAKGVSAQMVVSKDIIRCTRFSTSSLVRTDLGSTVDVRPLVIDAVASERRRQARLALRGGASELFSAGNSNSPQTIDALVLAVSEDADRAISLVKAIAEHGFRVGHLDPLSPPNHLPNALLNLIIFSRDTPDLWRQTPIGRCFDDLSELHMIGSRQRWLPVYYGYQENSDGTKVPSMLKSFDALTISDDAGLQYSDILRVIAAIDHDRARL
jgi:WD40 repeat protein